MARERIPHPRPNREVELRSSGTSKAVTRKMTEEDWVKYGPLNTESPRLKNKNKNNEEVIDMKRELTKDIYLSERINGKSNAKIEREYGLSPNSIYPIMKSWGLSAKTVNEIVATAKKPLASAEVAEEPVKIPKVKPSEQAVTQETTDSFIAATVERDQQILSKASPKKSGRMIQVDTTGGSEAIESELEALGGYIAAMPVKQYRLELSLVEVLSGD